MNRQQALIPFDDGYIDACLCSKVDTSSFEASNRPLVIFAHGFGADNGMAECFRLLRNIASGIVTIEWDALLFSFPGTGMSDGNFSDTSPQSRIDTYLHVYDWAMKNYHPSDVVLLGFSMGGGVAIHTATMLKNEIKGLITINSVPSFDRDSRSAQRWIPQSIDEKLSFGIGSGFYTNVPNISIAEAYSLLEIPKLRIQGRQDIPFFAEDFDPIYQSAPEPKHCVDISTGSHCFDLKSDQDIVCSAICEWLRAL